MCAGSVSSGSYPASRAFRCHSAAFFRSFSVIVIFQPFIIAAPFVFSDGLNRKIYGYGLLVESAFCKEK